MIDPLWLDRFLFFRVMRFAARAKKQVIGNREFDGIGYRKEEVEMFSELFTDEELNQLVKEMIEEENLPYEYCRQLSDEEFDEIF